MNNMITITAQDLLSHAGLGGGVVSITGLRAISTGVAAYSSEYWDELPYSPLSIARERYGNDTHLYLVGGLQGKEWLPIK